jgi:primosomal protein N' (replication factor Y) (superfamily II helicase)
MADTWDEGTAGLLLSDLPARVAAADIAPEKEQVPPGRRTKAKDARTLRPAADRPVGRIAVDLSLAHLDRPFDYLVPERLADRARPGVRVRIRFAGQLTDGFLVERAEKSEHQGSLRYLDRVVSDEQVLTEEILGLARAVADRYAGTLADVLRLAVPQRHAATEAAAAKLNSSKLNSAAGASATRGSARRVADGEPGGARGPLPPRPDAGPWSRYPAGPSFLGALAACRPARAAWTALPGAGWPEEIARAAVTTASAGRGVVIVVPDARDLARVDEALAAFVPAVHGEPYVTAAGESVQPAGYVTLTADLGPAERYRRWLAALHGDALIVAGTRAAMFAPVRDLGLVVLWDDGDDLHAEPHAPYPNAREVLALRAHRAGAAALIGGFARTTELTQLVRAGWAHELGPSRATLRAAAPRVRPAADDKELHRDEAATIARLPSLALRTAREALQAGPVLIQVPRRGYLAGIACARCRAQARCTRQTDATGAQCNGPLRLSGPHAAPDCRWCGALATGQRTTGQGSTVPSTTGPATTGPATTGPGGWLCPRCGHDKLRATITGAARTAEELGRAFPGVKVRTSGGDLVLPRVSGQPALVIATPGAEPLADYAAALLLDGWALLSRPSLRAGEETLRRWLAAAALVRPDGTVLVHADAALPATQALIRWDPVTFAERDLAERAELGFPPAVRMAAVTGEPAAVATVISSLASAVESSAAAGSAFGGRTFEVLGPVPFDQSAEPGNDQVRALVRAPRADSAALARALQAAQAGRSARKEGGGVRVQLDPPELI